jgi:hypothetical protein
VSPATGVGGTPEVISMNWFWINIPLDAVFALAVIGIPMWLVFRHPDTAPR